MGRGGGLAVGAHAAPPEPALAMAARRLVQRAPQHGDAGILQAPELHGDQVDTVVELPERRAAPVELAIGHGNNEIRTLGLIVAACIEIRLVHLRRPEQRRIAPVPVETHQAAFGGKGDRLLHLVLARLAGTGLTIVHEVVAHQGRVLACIRMHALGHIDAVVPAQVGLAGDDGLAPGVAQVRVDGAGCRCGGRIDRCGAQRGGGGAGREYYREGEQAGGQLGGEAHKGGSA